jgi:hypothetical protein
MVGCLVTERHAWLRLAFSLLLCHALSCVMVNDHSWPLVVTSLTLVFVFALVVTLRVARLC